LSARWRKAGSGNPNTNVFGLQNKKKITPLVVVGFAGRGWAAHTGVFFYSSGNNVGGTRGLLFFLFAFQVQKVVKL